MKKQLFTLFALLLTSLSGYAQTDSTYGCYAGALSGVNLEYFEGQVLKTHVGYAVGGFTGYKFYNNIRIEGEFSYRRNSFKKAFHGNRELYTLMGNAFYDFDLCSPWTPYIGFGMGYGHSKAKLRYKYHSFRFYSPSRKVQKDLVVWQGIAGLSCKIGPKTEVGGEYRILFAQEKSYNHLFALSLKQYF